MTRRPTFVSPCIKEVDFKKEAANIAAFQNYLDAAEITGAVAPFVYTEASSTKVLTMVGRSKLKHGMKRWELLIPALDYRPEKLLSSTGRI
jgi:hypothetical protein